MIKIPDHNNFHYRKILPDGRMLEFIFNNADIFEQALCRKLEELNDYCFSHNRKCCVKILKEVKGIILRGFKNEGTYKSKSVKHI